jgi:integrase
MSGKLTVTEVLDVLAAAGISRSELAEALAAPDVAPVPSAVPTVAEYLAAVSASTSVGARKTYQTYWNRLVEAHGNLPLDTIKTSQLRALANDAKARAVKRANGRNGVSAQENCVGAMRAFFRCAVEDGHIERNPAAAVEKPHRLPSRRRGFTDSELVELYEVTRSGGDDPALDTLLLRFHLETGARRGGALGLRLRDLDPVRQSVRLREKNDTERWQPVSKTLLTALTEHARSWGAVEDDDPVLRRLPRSGAVGVPITRRRYNTLAARWAKALPWAKERGVSIHWCRHHATSSIERLAGYAVARAFAGHFVGGDTTTTYITAHEHEVAQAVALYTSEDHPLAPASERQ